MLRTDILAPTDAAHLMSRGLAGPVDDDGTRRVNKLWLQNAEESMDPSAFAKVPWQLISEATIEYLGFTPRLAAQIWRGWINWPADGPQREIDPEDDGLQVSFLDFVKGHVSHSIDTSEDDDSVWKRCMQHWGVATELQEAIMDRRFKYLRLNNTCVRWVRETIKMRYAGLEDIQRASRERGQALRRAGFRPRGSNPSDSSASHPVSRISGGHRDPFPEISVGSCSSSSDVDTRDAPEMTFLYKAIDQARIRGVVDDKGRLNERWIHLLSENTPSEYSGNRTMYHFTTSFELAKYYAAYTKRRAKLETVVVVRIAIRNKAVEDMPEGMIQRIYWPDPEWKELIWTCRTGPVPRSLLKYRDAALIIGTMSGRVSTDRRSSSWQDISEDSVLKIDGQPAIQYAFSSEIEGQELLVTHAARTVKVLPFLESEFHQWMDKHEPDD
ncbi:hypothetical protein FSARC_9475 [Fusarium sarcochroum]|uniref:Uncharacterized protein n=1 Tax=Fusarium sarcochroum TaxID=1208366 RepID=A0A8H4X668_9HYPO|nr:hypothetical protein FSARC_9475 [Fusarium sarcochroum]